MEVLFNEEEKKYLAQTLKIDFEGIMDSLKDIENIFIIEHYSDRVIKIIERAKLDFNHKLIYQGVFNYISNKNFSKYFLNSFNYYFKSQKNELNLCRGNDNNINFDKFKNALLNYECSLLNLLLEIVELKTNMNNKRKVAIFQSCQIERHPLNLMLEVKNIRDYLIASVDYYPIVRFSTNKKIFKKTLEVYVPDMVHFVCHGEVNGDLQFFNGNATGVKYLSPEYFEKILSIYNNKKLIFVYFNSCYSKKFVCKAKKNDCSKYISNFLGYDGENNDYESRQFSEKFYNELVALKKNIVDTYLKVFDEYPDVYVKSDGKKINYKNNLYFV